MNVNEDLVGKTITGVIASPLRGSDLREIWVMQFADGSHVEFVSPGARKALRRATRQNRAQARGQYRGQNRVEASERTCDGAAKVAKKLTNSRSTHYQRELETGAQLTLNVA